MSPQWKQMRIGAYKGFAYHPLKVVILAKCNRYEVDFLFYVFLSVVCASAFAFMFILRKSTM
jgi:hypothetical protein